MPKNNENISLRQGEIDLLKGIKKFDGKVEIRELAASEQKEYVEIMRIAQWLLDKGLIEIKEEKEKFIRLLDEGKKFAEIGLPERRVAEGIKKLDKPVLFRELPSKLKIPENEVKIALGWLRNKHWGIFKKENGNLKIIVEKIPPKGADEKLLEALVKHKKIKESELDTELRQGVELLKKRKKIIEITPVVNRYLILTDKGEKILSKGISIIKEVSRLTPQLIRSGKWREVKFRKFDVSSPVSKLYPGKIHPINNLIKEIREIFFEFGFEEIDSKLIETTFWNFDALFVPQDHPARDAWDTFYLQKPSKGKLPAKSLVNSVKATHENGGMTGSKGWGYKWSEKEAEKLILRTHTTAATIKFAAMNPEPPRKVFCIDRLYRNEKQDYKHLAEFMQIEGIIIDENVSLRDLFGFLQEFYKKMGFPKIKFRPGYFPFTEPSIEADLYSPKLDKWLEMVGAGIFRPEVTKPLGINAPVLAWGMGFERLAMLRLGIEDMRKLYQNNINWLRETPTIIKRRI
ncbi:MAG: phenylalanine--tRNA ligase subunit alpha [Candidatus Odinarchaeia archaeon]